MKRKILLLLILTICLALLAACAGDTDLPRSFTVSFDTGENGYAIKSMTVKEGYSLRMENSTPQNKVETAIFRGWYTDSEFTEEWDVENSRVSGDVTLYAKWSYPAPEPTEISLCSDAFTKSITWIQSGITNPNQISVSVVKGEKIPAEVYDERLEETVRTGYLWTYDESAVTELDGTVEITDTYTITFTANEALSGGMYKLYISTNIEGVDTVTVDGVQFKGTGTKDDPYLVYTEEDLIYITTNSFGQDTYTELMQDVTVHSVYSDKIGCVYDGSFNGMGNTITIRNNSGLFYEIGEHGKVFNLSCSGSISGSDPSLGVVANYNRGLIFNVNSSAVSVRSQGGTVNDITTLAQGGAGGIVGTNYATGEIKSCKVSSARDNVIQGKIAVGGIAGINYGYIHDMASDFEPIIGAYNGNEISKTISNSFAGGVVGYNAGTVEYVNMEGKINCRRVDSGAEGDGAQNIGGIVGYNAADGVINECFFQGMRIVGDTNVGGIAGYNDGKVTNCYSGRRIRKPSNTTIAERQFISPVIGSFNVGGIVGKVGENSVISNVFSTANVWSYGMQGYSVAEKADNAISVAVCQNPRTGSTYLGQKYGEVYSNELLAPIGNNNLIDDNSARQGTTVNHLLGNTYDSEQNINVKDDELVAKYLEVLGESFFYDKTWGIVLSWNRG